MPDRRRRTRTRTAARERPTEFVAVKVARPRVRAAAAQSTEDRIGAWVKSVDSNAQVSFGPPAADAKGRGASVYLLDIQQQLPARGVGRPPLQLWVRYLVTTWAPDESDANQLLLELAFAAAEQHDLEIETEHLSPETWTALQAVARPSFVMRMTASRARAQPVAPPVLHPLRLEAAQPALIAGVVRTPGGMPLADALVVLPSIGHETSTDGRGRFQLANAPGPPVSQTLVVRVKGVETIVQLPRDPARARALVIEVDPLEEGTNAR